MLLAPPPKYWDVSVSILNWRISGKHFRLNLRMRSQPDFSRRSLLNTVWSSDILLRLDAWDPSPSA